MTSNPAVRDHLSDYTFLYDIGLNSWNVSKSDVFHPRYIDLFLGFRNYGRQMVVFSNLSFDVSVTRKAQGDQDAVEVFTDHEPKPGIQFVMTDQAYLYNTRVEIDPGYTYVVKYTVHHAGLTYTHEDEHTIPIPDQPYPSWVLGEHNMWYPPVPYPEDATHMYRWDEASISWVVI